MVFLVQKNIVATIVNVAQETGGNLQLIAERLISSGLVSAANLLSSILSVLGATDGAAITTDSNGTLQQYLRGISKTISSVWDINNGHLNIVQDGSGNEVVLHVNQLLSSGSLSGVLQGISGYVATIPTANSDTFILTNGVVTETWTFKAARTGAFEVAIGATAATAQTNLVAAIVADSTLWTALVTTNLGMFFVANPSSQFIIYRKAVPNSNSDDRIYGNQTVAAGIKIINFSQLGYSLAGATEVNIPAVDPGDKTFGFGRALASLSVGERHRSAEDSFTYAWNHVTQCWRFNWDLADLGIGTFPYPGTSVYLSISGVSAEMAADLPSGHYIVMATCDMTFAITASGGGGSVTWATSPGIIWPAMTPYYLPLMTAKRLAAITTGGATGTLMVAPVSTAPVI